MGVVMDDVLTELRLATESIDRLYSTQRRHNAAVEADIAKLWEALEGQGDDLVAVANRLESLTRLMAAEAVDAEL